jgi:hypothetical protein
MMISVLTLTRGRLEDDARACTSHSIDLVPTKKKGASQFGARSFSTSGTRLPRAPSGSVRRIAGWRTHSSTSGSRPWPCFLSACRTGMSDQVSMNSDARTSPTQLQPSPSVGWLAPRPTVSALVKDTTTRQSVHELREIPLS